MRRMLDDARRLRWKADAVLAGVTLVWGSSFIVVKHVVETEPPLAFLFWRFALALLLAAALSARRPKTPGLLRDGAAVGFLLAAGMVFQVVGQRETTASKAAFLTGLSVVLTPLAAYLRTRTLPSLENGIGIALAGAGFVLLTFPREGGPLNRGDLWLLGCGVVFAFYIVELSERGKRHDALRMTAVQLGAVALTAGALSILVGALGPGVAAAAGQTRRLVWSGDFLGSVLYLASIGTVGTFFGQTWAQRRMSATHAAILFALEPVFAVLLAAWLLAERLDGFGIAGGVLVLAGIAVSEVRFRASRRNPEDPAGEGAPTEVSK